MRRLIRIGVVAVGAMLLATVITLATHVFFENKDVRTLAGMLIGGFFGFTGGGNVIEWMLEDE